jgi:RNA polymerase sigma factor (sigma-70 family)
LDVEREVFRYCDAIYAAKHVVRFWHTLVPVNFTPVSVAIMGRETSVRVKTIARADDEADFDRLCLHLLDAVSRHDEKAFRRLYDLTVGRVYHLANRITGKNDLAEDTVLEVYLQAWREAPQYDSRRGRVLTWLLVICRSRALDCLRRCDRAEPVSNTDGLSCEDGSLVQHPESMLLLLERNHAVHRAILKLSAAQRQVISLAFMRGLSHHEIAACAAMPLGTVKTHLRKAIEALKRELADHEENL